MKILTCISLFILQYCFVFSQDSSSFDGTLHASIFCNKRIVAIGEATHGSHQEQTFKISIIKDLVRGYGYNTLLLEAYSAAIIPLNKYIQNDTVFDIRNEMVNDSRLYWTWKTDEYVDLFDWLKLYNKTSGNKVEIKGIDDNSKKGRDSLMAVNVARLIDEDKGIKAILLAHNEHIANNDQYTNAKSKSMGAYLKNLFGQDYFTIGQMFGKGSFNVFVINNSVLDTSFVSSYANVLNEKLSNNENEIFVLTKESKLLNKTINMWMYGATVPNIGYKYIRKINPAIYFDAIIFHDSISSASNLMRNGNYFVQSTYVVRTHSLVHGDTLAFKLSYNTNCKSLVEVQLYRDELFCQSFIDTLFVGENFLLRKIGLNAEINRIKANVFLFSNGSLSIQNSSILCNESRQISSNVFEESNNKTIPISGNSKLELILKYEDNQFKMLRRNRFGN